MNKKTLGSLIREVCGIDNPDTLATARIIENIKSMHPIDNPDALVTERIIKHIKSIYPIIHYNCVEDEFGPCNCYIDYLCTKNKEERCRGYCSSCELGVKLK